LKEPVIYDEEIVRKQNIISVAIFQGKCWE